MSEYVQRPHFQLALALCAVLLATVTRWLLDPWLDNHYPYGVFYIATTIVAWVGGWRPALIMLFLGFLSGNYYFIEPRGALTFTRPADIVGTLMYFTVGLVNVGVVGAMHSAQRRAQKNAALAAVKEQALQEEISLRRQAEIGLTLREQQFATLVENSPDLVGRIDLNRRYMYVSPAVQRLTGKTPTDFIGKTCWQAGLAPETCRTFDEHVDEVIASGQASRREFIEQTSEGARYMEARLIPELGADGSLATLLLIVTDVSAQRRTIEALRESEERLNAILQATPAVIYLMDAESRFVHVNRRFEDLFGYTSAQLRGKSVYEVFPTDIATMFESNNRRILAENDVNEFDETAPHPDGPHAYTSVKAPLRDAQGRPVGIVGVSTDISERKRMEEQLREADRRKDIFLATLAHELRNPLAPIRNALEILKRADSRADLAERARATMERQIVLMVRLIDDLLDLSRITRDTLDLRKERIELASVLRAAIESCKPQLDKGCHELQLSLPAEPVYLEADPVRLAQVFCNIISNACKYSEPRGNIRVVAETHAHEVTVSIVDNGIGIPPHLLPEVFGMFVQVDRSLERSQGGLGIGLALAQRLVEMHNGTIKAYSEGLDKGSRFVVCLPLATSTADTSISNEEHTVQQNQPCRVLVVDDNIDSADSLALLLELSGNTVFTAHDGEQAFEAAERERPDVVLLDIGLPKLNGYDVAAKIREQSWGRDMFLVALTGWGQEEDRRRSSEAGFNHHLVKPVDPAALMKLIASLR